MISDDPISKAAVDYIKKNAKLLCRTFADKEKFRPVAKPSTYFMAGSPGAGKTEYSKAFIKILEEREPDRKIVRIDADEIRDILPQYNRKNAQIVQSAAFIGVEKLYDHTLKNQQDCVIDGTFAVSLEKSYSNIKRSLSRGRKVGIVYIYQDPILAWDFTKKREALEGRGIPKDMFIRSFFAAKNNVNQAKKEFGKDIEVWLITKNFNQGVEKTFFNIDNIDNYLKFSYNSHSLEKALKNL